MAHRLEGWVMELVWMFREVEEGGGGVAHRHEGWVMELVWMFREVEEGEGEWHIGLKAG